MRLPTIRGVIDRRILVNYRLDPAVAAGLLPRPFRPKLAGGHAVAGICLIRLAHVRPAGWPAAVGVGSENAAHRFAVEWDGPDGQVAQGVYIPRRDSSSRLNAALGGRLVPGEHHHARFDVEDDDGRLSVRVASDDGRVRVAVSGRPADALPARSVFASVDAASRFFEAGSLGYSATRDPGRFDGIELRCDTWQVRPLAVDEAVSSYFDDPALFPPGSVALDCALLMRHVDHEWRSRADLHGSGVG